MCDLGLVALIFRRLVEYIHGPLSHFGLLFRQIPKIIKLLLLHLLLSDDPRGMKRRAAKTKAPPASTKKQKKGPEPPTEPELEAEPEIVEEGSLPPGVALWKIYDVNGIELEREQICEVKKLNDNHYVFSFIFPTGCGCEGPLHAVADFSESSSLALFPPEKKKDPSDSSSSESDEPQQKIIPKNINYKYFGHAQRIEGRWVTSPHGVPTDQETIDLLKDRFIHTLFQAEQENLFKKKLTGLGKIIVDSGIGSDTYTKARRSPRDVSPEEAIAELRKQVHFSHGLFFPLGIPHYTLPGYTYFAFDSTLEPKFQVWVLWNRFTSEFGGATKPNFVQSYLL